jgi:hypothetical protein
MEQSKLLHKDFNKRIGKNLLWSHYNFFRMTISKISIAVPLLCTCSCWNRRVQFENWYSQMLCPVPFALDDCVGTDGTYRWHLLPKILSNEPGTD